MSMAAGRAAVYATGPQRVRDEFSFMTRDALHALVNEIPDDQVSDVAELVEAYRRGDRLAVQLLLAPTDHAEPNELEAIAGVGDDDFAAAAPIETVKTRLGL